jgi:uncharacterized protein DUF2332
MSVRAERHRVRRRGRTWSRKLTPVVTPRIPAQPGSHAVLYPAIAEAARRAGATAIGLVDFGDPAGPNLDVDRVGISYSDGQSLGDSAAAVQVSASVVGKQVVPARAIPAVVSRTAVSLDPELLADAIAGVPANALPVVITTWALSHLSLEHRLRFLHRLDDATSERTVAWVSLEGVGVAPAIPTLGDRRASGHSIIGLALFDHMSLSAGAIGRCWSRGRFLEWLADS